MQPRSTPVNSSPQKLASWKQRPLPVWLETAVNEEGQKAVAGSRHNRRIVEYHAMTLVKVTDDETPWGSSFVNWCFGQVG